VSHRCSVQTKFPEIPCKLKKKKRGRKEEEKKDRGGEGSVEERRGGQERFLTDNLAGED
jgi:hypothetical protein